MMLAECKTLQIGVKGRAATIQAQRLLVLCELMKESLFFAFRKFAIQALMNPLL